MKKVILTVVVAGMIIGFVSPQELHSNSSSEGFSIQQKGNAGL
ncbi:hypothetical protein P4631_19455 [Halalkalibacterium halodurans]|nr:hypothetical protein [Halalkalibacterium halodurans]